MNYRKRCYICKSSENIHRLSFEYVCEEHYKDYLEFSKFRTRKESTKTPEQLQKNKRKIQKRNT